jgi:hypothetical protein
MSATTTRRPLPALAFLLVLTVITAVVWWRVLHRPGDSSSPTAGGSAPVTAVTCASGGKPIKLPTAASVTVDVLNGSNRYQLATTISNQLKARGFATGKPQDSPTPFTGVAQIRYGTAGKAGATLLSYHLPGAVLVTERRPDAAVHVVLGAAFRALATPAVAAKAVARAKKPC